VETRVSREDDSASGCIRDEVVANCGDGKRLIRGGDWHASDLQRTRRLLACYPCRVGRENLCGRSAFNNGASRGVHADSRPILGKHAEVPHAVDDHSAHWWNRYLVLRGVHEMEVRTGDTTG